MSEESSKNETRGGGHTSKKNKKSTTTTTTTTKSKKQKNLCFDNHKAKIASFGIHQGDEIAKQAMPTAVRQ